MGVGSKSIAGGLRFLRGLHGVGLAASTASEVCDASSCLRVNAAGRGVAGLIGFSTTSNVASGLAPIEPPASVESLGVTSCSVDLLQQHWPILSLWHVGTKECNLSAVMEVVRKKHPVHIPCRFRLPDKTELKLLVPRDATAGWAMHAARCRMSEGSSTTGYFLFCGGRMCVGSTPLSRLDTDKPNEIHFVVMEENTFG